jgi:proline iminopeptidase
VSRAVPVAGGALHVTVTGEGPPALLLHGGPGLSDFLEPLALLLARDVTTYRYTQRGVPPAPTDGPFTVAQHVTDAVAVLDAFELERPVIIGNSWGGFLALAVLAARPDRVRAIISIDGLGVTGDDGGLAEYDAGVASRMSPADAARSLAFEERAVRGEATDEEATAAVKIAWRVMFADPDAATTPPDLRLNAGAYGATAADALAVLAAGTLPQQLAGCPVPALFLPGELSPMPHWAAEQAASLLPSGQVVTIPGAAHFPFLENATATRDAIVAFLAAS